MSVRRDRQLDLITPSMQHYDAEKAVDWLDAIRRQVCPFCNAGPFTVVANHVSRVHSVDRKALRDMLGIFQSESICDPFHSKAAGERARRAHQQGRTGIHPMTPGTRKRLGPAAMREQKRKASLLTDETRAEIGRAASATRLSSVAERDATIVEMIRAGQRYHQIAERFDVATTTVRAIARRNGLGDGRHNYWESRKGHDDPSLMEGRRRRAENEIARTSALVAAFHSGRTVYELADQSGVTVKSLRERLRNAGVDLPDGRADPNRPKRTRL